MLECMLLELDPCQGGKDDHECGTWVNHRGLGMTEADACWVLQPPGMNVSECSPKYAISVCLRWALGWIYRNRISIGTSSEAQELIPLTWPSGFCNSFNFTWYVVEEDEVDFRRRHFSGSFNENEVLDFGFMPEVWLRTREVSERSRGVECRVVGWSITSDFFDWGVAFVMRWADRPDTQKPFIQIPDES